MNNKTNTELKQALQKIVDWEMPKTGKYWDDEKTQEMSYAACYGTQGEQIVIQDYAQNALTILAGYGHAAAELRWIPVSERLPERCQSVLITTKDLGYVLKAYLIRENHPRGDVWVSGSANGACYFEFDVATAWMPLPKPYTEPADNIGEEEGLVRALKERSMLDPDAPDAIVLTSDAASEY